MSTEYSLINTLISYKFSNLEMQFLWMSHEINLISLNITFRRWECLQQLVCPGPASGKLWLAPVWHTLNNSFDLVQRDQHLLQNCIEGLGVSWCHFYALDPLSKDVTDMLKCRHVWPVNTHNIIFADSSEVCSGTDILGLVLSLVFAQKKAGKQTSTSHPCTIDWSKVPV